MQSSTVLGAILVGLLLVGIVALGIARHHTRFTRFQFTLWIINLLLVKLLWRGKVQGSLRGFKGGAVVVCNHTSSIDPAFIQIASERPVHWMVAAEYFKNPYLGAFLRTLMCIPVNRGGIDTAATKMAIRYAKNGNFVGMFPEGRINTTDEVLLPGRPGAALVALRAGVPVIPCHVSGVPYNGTALSPLFMTGRVTLKIGKAIDLTEYYGRTSEEGLLEELTKRFMKEIATLGGYPDFEPSLAGRRWKTAEDAAEAPIEQ